MDRVNRSYYGTKNSNSSSITHSAYNQEIELIGVIRKTERFAAPELCILLKQLLTSLHFPFQ